MSGNRQLTQEQAIAQIDDIVEKSTSKNLLTQKANDRKKLINQGNPTEEELFTYVNEFKFFVAILEKSSESKEFLKAGLAGNVQIKLIDPKQENKQQPNTFSTDSFIQQQLAKQREEAEAAAAIAAQRKVKLELHVQSPQEQAPAAPAKPQVNRLESTNSHSPVSNAKSNTSILLGSIMLGLGIAAACTGFGVALGIVLSCVGGLLVVGGLARHKKSTPPVSSPEPLLGGTQSPPSAFAISEKGDDAKHAEITALLLRKRELAAQQTQQPHQRVYDLKI